MAVGTAAIGGLLIWSAIRNVSPVDTLREVLGQPSSGTPISTPYGSTTSGVGEVLGQAAGSVASSVAAGVAGSVAGEAAGLVAQARSLIGVPYVWAAASPSGVDCSGLVVLCLRRMGAKNVPRFTTFTFGAWAKSQGASRVDPAGFAAGDVILRSGHMGIAVSSDRMIHAPHVGSTVQEAAIYDKGNWWGWRLFTHSAQEGMGSK